MKGTKFTYMEGARPLRGEPYPTTYGGGTLKSKSKTCVVIRAKPVNPIAQGNALCDTIHGRPPLPRDRPAATPIQSGDYFLFPS